MEPAKSKGKEIVIGIFCVIVFAAAYYLTLTNFLKEGENPPTIIHDEAAQEKDFIRVGIQVINVDPVKGDMQARMNFVPNGDFTEDQITLSKEVTLYVNSVSGKNEHVFPKGKRMNPIDVTLELYDGLVTDYPFDKHTADLEMYMVTKEKTDSGTTVEENVPVVKEIDFKANIHGFKIEEVRNPGIATDYTEIEINIERTKPVLYFAIFIMILMWAIAIVCVFILLSVIVRNRKIEYSMFAFFATLLFALPALRGIQPFVPALGCLSDFIAFFWAEGIVAVCLFLMILTWLKRPSAKQT